ncbi:MAG: hypothetical protein H6R00_3176 [Proteobacteria bacterium]|nr:hypothetical protein [Pseudomonadota bacterium]
MLDTVVNKLRSYRKYQETYRELSRLSTRELADLGISRGEISNAGFVSTDLPVLLPGHCRLDRSNPPPLLRSSCDAPPPASQVSCSGIPPPMPSTENCSAHRISSLHALDGRVIPPP